MLLWLHCFYCCFAGEGKVRRVGVARLMNCICAAWLVQLAFCFVLLQVLHMSFKWPLSNDFRFLKSKDIAIFLKQIQNIYFVYLFFALQDSVFIFLIQLWPRKLTYINSIAGSLAFWLPSEGPPQLILPLLLLLPQAHRGIHTHPISSPRVLQYPCDFPTSYWNAVLHSLRIIQSYFDIHFLLGLWWTRVIISIM